MRVFKSAAAATAIVILSGAAGAVEPMCATAEQKAKVAEHLQTSNPGIATAATARVLELPEEIVASAVGEPLAIGIKGAAFQQVWETLPAWGETFFLIMKGGHVFELETKIVRGQPSGRSSFYNLDRGAPLSGHLRGDLISSIYAFDTPQRGQTVQGVMFYGPPGESMFAAIVREESPAEQKAAFQKTLVLIKTLPKACS
jgi:putative heme iron utilization protein